MEKYLIAAALGVSLSACCGFRVFIPLLIASLSSKFGLLPLSSGFEWLSSYWAIIMLSSAVILEIVSYYIPVFDNILDFIAAPAAVVAGVIVSASVMVDFDPMLKWTLAIIAGGGSAGAIHAGTGLLRIGSTKFTGATGNHLLATVENFFSLFGSVASLLIPLIMFVLFFLLVVVIATFTVNRFFRSKSASAIN